MLSTLCLQTVIKEHKKTLDADHPRDLIDIFLIENKKEEHKDDDGYTGKMPYIRLN